MSDSNNAEPGSRRGRMHNAEGARKAILDAAEQVFAEHGFDGARIDAIAAASGYNKSLIFQYFGDKLALYSEVIRRADEQTRDLQNEAFTAFRQIEASSNPDQVVSLLGRYIGWYFDYLVENPNIRRIYMWEMAEGWQTFSKIVIQRDFDDISEFQPLLLKLQNAELLRSEHNPLLQLSSALFMCPLYLAILPLYNVLTPQVEVGSPSELAQARKFIIEFVVQGLLKVPLGTRT